MKVEQKTISLDTYEEGAIIEALNKMRTEKIQSKEPDEFVSELLLKIIRTPSRKVRARNESR